MCLSTAFVCTLIVDVGLTQLLAELMIVCYDQYIFGL